MAVSLFGLHGVALGQKPMQSHGSRRNTRSLPRAKVERAAIHWGDETDLRSDDVRGRGYAPAGHTPVVQVNNKRYVLSGITTATNNRAMRWKIFEGAFDSDILTDVRDQPAVGGD